MTDQEKKSLRSFLKEMEGERRDAIQQSNRSRVGLLSRLIESYKETFAEDIFPACEVCSLPVPDEDSAGPGSNLHMSCYDKMLDEGE